MFENPEYVKTMNTDDLINYIKADDLIGVRKIRPDTLQSRSEFETEAIQTLIERGLTYPFQF
jgi:hypothetical protein